MSRDELDLGTLRVDHAERMAVGGAVKQPGIVGGYDLRGSDFAHPAARQLWDGMLALTERGIGWTGPEELALRLARDVGERRALGEYLAEHVVLALSSPRDVPAYVDEVRAASITRRALLVCSQAGGLALRGYEGRELVAELQAQLQALRAAGTGRLESRTGAEIAASILDAMERPDEVSGSGLYVPFGLPRLDRALGGWQGAIVHVLAGRTSHGKSAAMLQFALHAAAVLPGQRPVHVLSAEDLVGDTGRRMLSWLTDVPASSMARPSEMDAADRERVLAARAHLQQLDRIRLTPVPGMGARQVVSLVRRYQDEDGTGIVFFDYLQKLPKGRQHENENALYTEAMDVFDLASKEDGMPWVIGSQVKRSDRAVPSVADMRGSGAIEQTAKGVLIVHRPNFGTSEPDDRTLIAVPKWSNGEVCDVLCRWDGPRMRIIDEPPFEYDGQEHWQ